MPLRMPEYTNGPYWEPRDLWVGVYWTRGWIPQSRGRSIRRLDVYICLVPCFPIRLVWITDPALEHAAPVEG